MIEIVSLLVCLVPSLSGTTVRQLSRIVVALLSMSGRVTMLGISRWAGQGGSYRTVQRFFGTVIPWGAVFWLFFRTHLLDSDDVYLLAGDECVVTKSGKHTHGLDRFFSSLYGKPVPGLSFFALSLISTKQRHSYPMHVEQVVKTGAEQAAAVSSKKAPKNKTPRKRGRPKGSKNKDKTQVTLTPELLRIQGMVQTLLTRVGNFLSLSYLVLDGYFGNNNAMQMTLQCGLQLISKLRFDAALYFPYEGEYAGRGPRRKYGDRLKPDAIPTRYLKRVTIDKGTQTRVYQAQMLHKEFPQPLNVVVILKTHLATGRQAHVLLFSSHLTLPYDKLIDSYCLRFQLEFNFRDAKQFWGLEDFMNIKPTAVTNAANLALFMVNVSRRLLHDFRQTMTDFSVLDLKAHYRGIRYLDEVIKILPQIPEPIVMDNIKRRLASLGAIHDTIPKQEPA